MAEQVWDGVTQSATLSGWVVHARQTLANCANRGDWTGMFAVLGAHPAMINASRLDGTSWYAPLHQAAYGGAPAEVIERLIKHGALRLLRAADGALPVEIARSRGQAHVLDVLEPQPVVDVDADELADIQSWFHRVIRGRAAELVDEHRLRLPELAVLTESPRPAAWFPIPGMYGGFSVRLEPAGSGWRLTSESWSRVVGGSGQRHEITARHARLVADGFE